MWHWLKSKLSRKHALPVDTRADDDNDVALGVGATYGVPAIKRKGKTRDRPGLVLLKSGRWISAWDVQCLIIEGADIEKVVA